METEQHFLMMKKNKPFKIDLIVWKPCVSSQNITANRLFKIDLIVWKLITVKNGVIYIMSLK